MRLNVPVALVVIGGTLSVFAYAATRDWEEARATRDFEREAIGYATNLRRKFSSTIEAVHSIRALYGASIEVGRAEFRAFASVKLEDQGGIQALEWIPRVAAADRAAFEAAAREDGLAGFSFTEQESQGHMVAAPTRAEYFPVYFVEPLAGNEAAVGFDLGSDPARLAALEKARDSGKTVATARITLVQETGDQYGLLVIEPIYRKGAPVSTVEERRAALQGFALSVLRVGDIVESTLAPHDHLAGTLEMFVFDNSAPAGQRLLYPRSALVDDRADMRVAGCVDTPFRIGGRDWLFVHCPAGGMAATERWKSWTVLIEGLAVTGALALYLLLMMRERARTERLAEGLRASEERYRGLFDNAHDMIQSTDAEGWFAFVNRSWTEAMGYTMDELAEVGVFDLIAPHSKAHCLAAFERVMAGEAQDNVPVTFIRKDGRPLEAEGNIAPQFSAGRIVATQGIFRDVTERNRSEQALKKSEAGLANAQRIAHLGSWDWNIVTNELHWSDENYRIFGLEPQDFGATYKVFMDSVHPDDRAYVQEMVDRALDGKEAYSIDRRVVLPSGEQRVVHEQAEVTFDDTGKPIRMNGTVQDITERRRMEAELNQAAKMATLGEMATGVAHELNQPLNVIRMAADSTIERIEESDFDAGYLRGKLERISAQTERAAAIIDHMRIFGHKADEKPELIDLRGVARDALGLIGEQLRLCAIEVETDLPKVCRLVLGHAVQLEQVVLNLLGNARDAIEVNRQGPGQPRKITVKVEDTGPVDNVRLIVEDSGGGIPDKIIKRVFEPFFTTKQTGHGTGLGMSISYGIVSDMGGAIEAANTGDGARITITLPVAAEQTSAA